MVPIQTKISFYQLIHLIFIEKRNRSITKLFVALLWNQRWYKRAKSIQIFLHSLLYCTFLNWIGPSSWCYSLQNRRWVAVNWHLYFTARPIAWKAPTGSDYGLQLCCPLKATWKLKKPMYEYLKKHKFSKLFLKNLYIYIFLKLNLDCNSGVTKEFMLGGHHKT